MSYHLPSPVAILRALRKVDREIYAVRAALLTSKGKARASDSVELAERLAHKRSLEAIADDVLAADVKANHSAGMEYRVGPHKWSKESANG